MVDEYHWIEVVSWGINPFSAETVFIRLKTVPALKELMYL